MPPPARCVRALAATGNRPGLPPAYPSLRPPCVSRLAGTDRRRSAWRSRAAGSAGPMAIADELQRIGAPVRRWARTQKHEYSRGEPRPLGGDLGAMGVYLGLVSAGIAAVRASGRDLPD